MAAVDRGPRRREWITRAAFEAALIVFGLVGALALNDWHDRRTRAAQTDAAIVSIRAELESNVKAVDQIVGGFETAAQGLRQQLSNGPVYGGAIIPVTTLSMTSWNAARDGATTADMPFDVLVILGRAYEDQAIFADLTTAFLKNVYTTPDPEALRRNPRALLGVLNDFDQRAKRLRERYVEALARLSLPLR